MAKNNKNTAPQDEEMDLDLMTLVDEDGVEITFEVIDNFEHNGTTYLAALEYVEDEADLDENAQLMLFKIVEDEEGEGLDIVEDDEELLVIGKIVEQRLAGDYEIQQ